MTRAPTWPIIQRALDINAQWAGEAGRLLKRSAQDTNVTFCIWNARQKKAVLPMWAVWSKPLKTPKHAIVVLAVNVQMVVLGLRKLIANTDVHVADSVQSMSVTLEELLSANAAAAAANINFMVKGTVLGATDVWSGEVTARVSKDAPYHVRDLEPHDSRFVVFAPAA
jgi:hypothetical protein